ncbi:MAG: hypothetical protein A2798_03880 [Candidatus Levybacteria bacterium RIFCSPHIGHO2_01_FULL_37_17]|nr:MAG: hypothetical protein A2798_03880 [Candidatus Levybacteria bacterium RIFCSPHIGHO2_01_FULL_37_17]OGH36607.1 MAG: hypothetical protein A2959_03935 [Candidatus Levybacteria bacterium RIFCSPLOWO2_01_FULL_38_23]
MPQRNPTLFFFILFISAVLIIVVSKFNLLNLATGVVQNVFAPAQTTLRNIFVKDESSAKQENLELASKLVEQQKLISDNKALKDQFQTVKVNSTYLIPAKIVGSPSFVPGLSVPEEFIINLGTEDGVKAGQAVVYKDNLVGIIKKANNSFSKVILVSASSFSLTAKTLSDSASGVARGKGGGQIIFENVLLSQRIAKDDLVVSRGSINQEGEGTAPNLIIGKIVSVNKAPSSLFQSAKIMPLIDFHALSTIFVVVKQ